MRTHIFLFASTLLFLFIGIVHLFRIVYDWEVIIIGISMPMWFSYLSVFTFALLVYSGILIVARREEEEND